jgi:site-specific DNA-cytosine methylase
MLGMPGGWVDVGISRNAQLRVLGNSVQVQCAEAVGEWLSGLMAGERAA